MNYFKNFLRSNASHLWVIGISLFFVVTSSLILWNWQTGYLERENGYTNAITKLKEENLRLSKKLKANLGVSSNGVVNFQVEDNKNESADSLHPHKDTKYAKAYDRDLSERDTRYGVSSKQTPFAVAIHKGGKRLDITAFGNTVKAVYQRMPHVKTSAESITLIVETAITETDRGRVLVLGDNYGVLQIQESTAKHLLTYLQTEHKDVYAAVESLRNTKHNLRWNLTYNVPYQIAMSITCYWHKLPNYSEHISTLEERATLWKSVYNTRLGKGTVEKYAQRVTLAMK